MDSLSAQMKRLSADSPFTIGRHSLKEKKKTNGGSSENVKARLRPRVQTYTEGSLVPKRFFLSPNRRLLIRNSWRRIGKVGSGGIGTLIFKRIHQKRPEMCAMFGTGTPSSFHYEPGFAKHAQVFVDVLSETVDNLGELDEVLAPKLYTYGKVHGCLGSRGFGPGYWDLFAEALTDSVMEWIGLGPAGQSRETLHAWTILVSYIVDKMRFGYDVEVRRIRRKDGSYSYPSSPNISPRNFSKLSSDQELAPETSSPRISNSEEWI